MADVVDLTDDELLEQLALRMRRRSHGHTVADVVRASARRFGIRVRDILGPRKYAAVAFSRQVAMYVARELTGESLPRLGAAFGGRHHTTVLHACRLIERRRLEDERTAMAVIDLMAELRKERSA